MPTPFIMIDRRAFLPRAFLAHRAEIFLRTAESLLHTADERRALGLMKWAIDELPAFFNAYRHTMWYLLVRAEKRKYFGISFHFVSALPFMLLAPFCLLGRGVPWPRLRGIRELFASPASSCPTSVEPMLGPTLPKRAAKR